MMTARCTPTIWLGPLITGLVLSVGCKKTGESGTPRQQTTSEVTAREDWLGFTPYPNARRLCNEFTLGFAGNHQQVEIHWITFATRDPVQDVNAFYTATEKGSVELKEGSLTIRRGDPVAAVLSVHPTSSPDYPTCAEKPRPEETTVIDASTMTRP